MAWTATQLADLEAAIAEGVLEVEYDDRKVRYRSLRDMIAARDLIRRELGLVKAGPRRVVAQHRKGLGSTG